MAWFSCLRSHGKIDTTRHVAVQRAHVEVRDAGNDKKDLTSIAYQVACIIKLNSSLEEVVQLAASSVTP